MRASWSRDPYSFNVQFALQPAVHNTPFHHNYKALVGVEIKGSESRAWGNSTLPARLRDYICACDLVQPLRVVWNVVSMFHMLFFMHFLKADSWLIGDYVNGRIKAEIGTENIWDYHILGDVWLSPYNKLYFNSLIASWRRVSNLLFSFHNTYSSKTTLVKL